MKKQNKEILNVRHNLIHLETPTASDNLTEQTLPRIDPAVKVVPLYDRLGGDYAVTMLVDLLVDRMRSGKTLKKYFEGVNIRVYYIFK